MKTKNAIWLLAGAASAGLGVLALCNPTTSAQTAEDSEDEALSPRRYNASLDEVRAALEALIPTLKTYGASWHLTETETYDASTPLASVVLRVEVPVLVFVNDLTVTLRRDESATIVEARSVSRMRTGSDLGENHRHIAQLLAALDEQL